MRFSCCGKALSSSSSRARPALPMLISIRRTPTRAICAATTPNARTARCMLSLYRRTRAGIPASDAVSASVGRMRLTKWSGSTTCSAKASSSIHADFFQTMLTARYRHWLRLRVNSSPRERFDESSVQRLQPTMRLMPSRRSYTRRRRPFTPPDPVDRCPWRWQDVGWLCVLYIHTSSTILRPRAIGKQHRPQSSLSGNGPLVEVLQYELRDAGGGGRTFVRDVKNYVKHHNTAARRIPSEHVLVYDEAQRAYDAAMVAAKHPEMAQSAKIRTRALRRVRGADSEWCVVVGLVGSGPQEIHTGEEAGTVQWADAVAGSLQGDGVDFTQPARNG